MVSNHWKYVRALDAPADLVGEHRLGGARRPDDQHVLAGEQRDQRAVDQLVALEELLPQLVPDGRAARSRGADTRRG